MPTGKPPDIPPLKLPPKPLISIGAIFMAGAAFTGAAALAGVALNDSPILPRRSR